MCELRKNERSRPSSSRNVRNFKIVLLLLPPPRAVFAFRRLRSRPSRAHARFVRIVICRSIGAGISIRAVVGRVVGFRTFSGPITYFVRPGGRVRLDNVARTRCLGQTGSCTAAPRETRATNPTLRYNNTRVTQYSFSSKPAVGHK